MGIALKQPRKLSGAAETRIDALKELAKLLIKEVESLENAPTLEIPWKNLESIDLNDEVQRFEIGLIRHALIQAGGLQCRAAGLLRIKKTTLNSKIKRYRLERFTVFGKR